MAQKRYVVIIPIITTLLLFASVSAIIGNAFEISTTNTYSRNFGVSNLAPDEVAANSIPMPDQIDNPEVRFSISYINLEDLNETLISIFLFETDPDFSRQSRSEFENSTYFDDELLTSDLEVDNSQTLYPGSGIDTLYIVMGNEVDENLSFSVFITIQEIDTTTGTDAGTVIAIILSSIMTALFFFGSIYLWLEFAEKVPARFLTDDLEEKMDYYQDKALSWELFVFGIAILMAVGGYAQLLVTGNGSLIVIALIVSGIVYYNFKNRQEIEESIRSVILSHDEISLKDLSELIGEDEATTKKALLDAIMYSNLPASFDFKTEMVKYDPDKEDAYRSMPEQREIHQASFQVASSEVQAGEVDPTEPQPSRPLPRCAYCDTEAISVNAQFCHSCGASMSSAK